jgi:hypothetical protein
VLNNFTCNFCVRDPQDVLGTAEGAYYFWHLLLEVILNHLLDWIFNALGGKLIQTEVVAEVGDEFIAEGDVLASVEGFSLVHSYACH